MKGLKTLIKLNKRALDDLRRQMNMLENQKAQLLQLSAKLREDLINEMKLASKTPEMGNFFGDFSKRMQARQAEIASEVRSLERQMDELNIKISEAFSELKKFEIALENAKRRADEAQARRETLQMDEIAEQQHRRKMEEQQ